MLKIPGAQVTDVLVQRSSVDGADYEVKYDLGIIQWKPPKTPERATVIIKLTEELSSKDLTRWWKNFAIIVSIISILLVASVLYFSLHTPVPCDQNVKITVPVHQQSVSMYEEIKGTFQDLPKGHKIWTMVYPTNARKFYPQKEAVLVGNTWSSKVIIGQEKEVEKIFHIYVVVADEEAHSHLSMYAQRAENRNDSPGLWDLPEGARTCQFIEVVRK